MNESAAAEQQLYLRHLPLNADLDATRLGTGLGAAWRYSQISTLTNLKVDSHNVQQLQCLQQTQVAAGGSRWQNYEVDRTTPSQYLHGG